MTTEILGRFGHQSDPACDFCIEVEAIQGAIADVRAGIGSPENISKRIDRAMMFRVGGDEIAVQAKGILRSLEKDWLA